MLSLTQDPLNEVIFNGKSYHLDLAFDTVLQYLQLSSDNDLSKEEKVEYAITLFWMSKIYLTIQSFMS